MEGDGGLEENKKQDVNFIEGKMNKTFQAVEDVSLFVHSIAGIATACYVHEWDLMFDVGCCEEKMFTKSHVFISHGHIDHIQALPKHAAMRSMMNLTPAKYYVLPELMSHVEEIMSRFSMLQQDQIPFCLVPITHEDEIRVRADLVVVPFKTHHRVTSLGYVVYTEKNKLKDEFKGKSSVDINRLKQNGVVVTTPVRVPMVAYTGDTTIDAFRSNPVLFHVKVLIVEVTYIDDAQTSVQKAVSRGHIHLNQLMDLTKMFRNQSIVLMHISVRYSNADIRNRINECVKQDLSPQLTVVTCR